MASDICAGGCALMADCIACYDLHLGWGPCHYPGEHDGRGPIKLGSATFTEQERQVLKAATALIRAPHLSNYWNNLRNSIRALEESNL
jgi:hypothetical protein